MGNFSTFVAFISYTLHVCLRQRCRKVAGGLTPRAVLEKFSAVQMIDVHLPCTDGRKVILSRYAQPEKDPVMKGHFGSDFSWQRDGGG